ncbi:MAG: hypothetical protein HQK51_00795, partial [Oligoflexia bacterium]|nr:hypothetical protein [Oligoflexia bacterium]
EDFSLYISKDLIAKQALLENDLQVNLRKILMGKNHIRYVPKAKAFSWLWNLLMGKSTTVGNGRDKQREASRVSPLSETFKQVAKNNLGIELKFTDLILRINVVGDEIIVSNLTDGYQLHYFKSKTFNLNFDVGTFFYMLAKQ